MQVHLPTAARDPVGALAECHVRIRAYLDGLGRIVALPDLADPRVPGAAAQARRYFVEGLPRHAADEDVSLGPRLLRVHPAHGPLLERLAREHAEADAWVERLLPFLDALVEGRVVDRAAFAEVVRELARLMEAHLQVEEADLFPALRGLDAVQLLAAGAEMVDRRRP